MHVHFSSLHKTRHWPLAHIFVKAFNFIQVPDLEISCMYFLFVWGWGEEFREDVEGEEDLERGKRGRGAE